MRESPILLVPHLGKLVPGSDFSVQAAILTHKMTALIHDKERNFTLARKLPAGYTYLGQFLAHELVPRPKLVTRSRKLDLDSLYGTNPVEDGSSDRYIDWSTGRLRARLVSGYEVDLPRDEQGKVTIPEIRNDDQVILSQLHLLLIRFHNRLVDELESELSPLEKFELAKRGVWATLCRIVFEDYLPRICQPNVFNAVFAEGRQFIAMPESDTLLPLELTHAALRFGHSQVRRSYKLNSAHAVVSLDSIFCQDQPIKEELVIDDWQRFFADGSQTAAIIDLRIADGVAGSGPNIVDLNLQAGFRVGLCSAVELVHAFHAEDIGVVPEIHFSVERVKEKSIFERHARIEELPIWPFVLLEASECESLGDRLGPLGSLLLCETLRNAVSEQDRMLLEQYQISVFHELAVLDSMSSLIDFVQGS